MADDPVSSSPDPLPETPTRRRVYELTLFPERKRRRFSPWLVVPLVLLVCGGLIAYLQSAGRRVRFVATAGEVVYASDQGQRGRLIFGSPASTAPGCGP